METENAKQPVGKQIPEDVKLKYPVQHVAHKGSIEEKDVKNAVKDLHPDAGSMDSRG